MKKTAEAERVSVLRLSFLPHKPCPFCENDNADFCQLLAFITKLNNVHKCVQTSAKQQRTNEQLGSVHQHPREQWYKSEKGLWASGSLLLIQSSPIPRKSFVTKRSQKDGLGKIWEKMQLPCLLIWCCWWHQDKKRLELCLVEPVLSISLS